MAILQRQVTLEEFLKLPEDKPALEFEDGMVTQKVSPKGQHSTLQSSIVKRVDSFALPRKLAMSFPELRSTFAGRSPVPDVSVYVWERIPFNDAGEVANDFYEPPDIAFEIVSPEQSVNALIRRCTWYVENGVRVALLIDPVDKSVVVFVFGQALRYLHGEDRIDLDDVLPGFELTVAELFSSLKVR